MRPLSLALCMAGCTGTDATVEPPDTTTPTEAPGAPECSEHVDVPGVLGTIDAEKVADPHADTFGTEAPDPYHVRYNWPSTDPSTSASFLWRTDLDTLATVVEFGPDGQLTERLEGASFRYGGAASGPGDYRIHEIKLCGRLQPGTTYSYRVGGEGHWSSTYTFTTPPAPGTFDTFRVAIVGDARGAYETWGALVAQMESHDPDFYVMAGDIVELGVLQDEWDAWFEAAGDTFAHKALLPAHGNHEFLAVHYFAQFSLPHLEQWYTIDYGDLRLVTLNDTVQDVSHRITQAGYLDAQLADSDAAWTSVVHHSAMYSASTVHGSFEDLRVEWEPTIDAHEVDLVLAAHNHLYERSVPIRAGAVTTPDDGTIYLVTGGAGAPLYTNTTDEWFTEVANPIEHFVLADFGPDGIEVTVRDRSDNVVDQFTVAR